MKAGDAGAAATIVALAGEKPRSTAGLREELGLSAWRFGKALGVARAQGAIRVDAGIVTVTEKGREILDAGPKPDRATRRRAQRRAAAAERRSGRPSG